jgi:hypothetical protein
MACGRRANIGFEGKEEVIRLTVPNTLAGIIPSTQEKAHSKHSPDIASAERTLYPNQDGGSRERAPVRRTGLQVRGQS